MATIGEDIDSKLFRGTLMVPGCSLADTLWQRKHTTQPAEKTIKMRYFAGIARSR